MMQFIYLFLQGGGDYDAMSCRVEFDVMQWQEVTDAMRCCRWMDSSQGKKYMLRCCRWTRSLVQLILQGYKSYIKPCCEVK